MSLGLPQEKLRFTVHFMLIVPVPIVPYVACMRGRRKGGKGSKQPQENWEERRRESVRLTRFMRCFFSLSLPSCHSHRSLNHAVLFLLCLIVPIVPYRSYRALSFLSCLINPKTIPSKYRSQHAGI